MEILPLSTIPYDPYVNDVIEAYFAAGSTDRAVEMTKDLISHFYAHLDYYLKQASYIVTSSDYAIGTAFEYARRAGEACMENGKAEMGIEINRKLQDYYAKYSEIAGPVMR